MSCELLFYLILVFVLVVFPSQKENIIIKKMLQVYFGKTKEMVCILRPPLEVVQPRLPEC